MKSTKAQIMEGVEYKEAKIINNNTVEYTRLNSVRVIRLHHTDIMEFPKLGGVILNSGGWKTVTTKERINEYNGECTLIQDKSIWYISTSNNPYQDKDSWIPFFDGIKIKDRKVVNPKKSTHRKEQVLLKRIQKYCKELKELPELPQPSNGDCWYCSLKDTDGKTFGDMGDNDHLISHLNEKYIHGSLIVNALEFAGYNNPAFMFRMDDRDSIVQAVRKYFKSKLGLVV